MLGSSGKEGGRVGISWLEIWVGQTFEMSAATPKTTTMSKDKRSMFFKAKVSTSNQINTQTPTTLMETTGMYLPLNANAMHCKQSYSLH